MKLSVSILIASTQGQRNREAKESDNDNTDVGAFADAFSDYFGNYDNTVDYSGFGEDPFDDYNDAFGTDVPVTVAVTAAPLDTTVAATADPFAGYDFTGAEDEFASYDGAYDASLDETVADIVSDVIDDVAGRPDSDDDESGKSSAFLQSGQTLEIGNADYAAWCWISSGVATVHDINLKPVANNEVGSAYSAWFDNGSWAACHGANQVCQIKVTRRQNNIEKIVSDCANQHSCVDNMRANFNPASPPTGNNPFFSSWTRQICRPTFGNANAAAYNGGHVRARGAMTPSVCYYCIEPCRDDEPVLGIHPSTGVTIAEQQTARLEAMQANFCVGRDQWSVDMGYSNLDNPYAWYNLAEGFDIFDEATHTLVPPGTPSYANDFTSNDNVYMTKTVTLTKNDSHGNPISQIIEISTLHAEQINMRGIGTQNGLNDLADGAQPISFR